MAGDPHDDRKDGYFGIPRTFLEQLRQLVPKLAFGPRVLYAVLADYESISGSAWAWPSRRKLAECLGVDQDCLQRWIKKLKGVRLLDVRPGSGRRPTYYRLLGPRILRTGNSRTLLHDGSVRENPEHNGRPVVFGKTGGSEASKIPNGHSQERENQEKKAAQPPLPPQAAHVYQVAEKREALKRGRVFGSPRTELAEDPNLSLRRVEEFLGRGMSEGLLVTTCRGDIAEARATADREAARREAQARAEARRRAEGAERSAMREKFDRWWASLNGRREEVAQEALGQAPRFVRALIDARADPVSEPRWRAVIYGKYEREIEKFRANLPNDRCVG